MIIVVVIIIIIIISPSFSLVGRLSFAGSKHFLPHGCTPLLLPPSSPSSSFSQYLHTWQRKTFYIKTSNKWSADKIDGGGAGVGRGDVKRIRISDTEIFFGYARKTTDAYLQNGGRRGFRGRRKGWKTHKKKGGTRSSKRKYSSNIYFH